MPPVKEREVMAINAWEEVKETNEECLQIAWNLNLEETVNIEYLSRKLESSWKLKFVNAQVICYSVENKR